MPYSTHIPPQANRSPHYQKVQYLKEYQEALGSVFDLSIDGDNVWMAHSSLSRRTGMGFSRLDLSTGELKTYSTPDGLAHNDVFAVRVIGKEVWAATAAGLSRYHLVRSTWTTYTVEDGLPSNAVLSLLFIPDDDETLKYRKMLIGCLPDEFVECGNLWVGTASGIARFKPGSDRFSSYRDGLEHQAVSALATDGHGILWCGSNAKKRALSRFNIRKKRFHPVNLGPQVRAIAVLDDVVCVAYVNGLAELDLDGTVVEIHNEIDPLAVAADRNRLWVGTAGDGVVCFNPFDIYPQHIGLSEIGATKMGLFVLIAPS